MSRVGKQPVDVPAGVKVGIQGAQVSVEGPRGKLDFKCGAGIEVAQVDGKLVVTSLRNDRQARADFGTTRAMLQNMVVGVTQGWKRSLTLTGVGYTAKLQGNELVLAVGLSHEAKILIPTGINCKVEKTSIELEANDKQVVGDLAARIRRVQPPEPYLGKGISYTGERIRRKAGKAGKK